MKTSLVLLAISSLVVLPFSLAYQCGVQNGGALCRNGLCCSKWGWCGITDAYCGEGCQSQCHSSPPPPPVGPSPPPPPPSPPVAPGNLSIIISKSQFERMLLRRNNPACPARLFYTYEAFIEAARSFPGFGTTGDDATRKREVAAFFGQTAHETTGGWPTAPDGPYAWGYCFKEEVNAWSDYCQPTNQWPCVPGKRYFGRGPIQLSWNYNYGQCGEALGLDLLSNPDLVANDNVIAFKTAIWFWMTPQAPKPSCHDVIIGQWKPSSTDLNANRLPGYGVITNIINGGLECGIGKDPRVDNRIGFYKRFCDIIGVSPGDNLDCYKQRPFGFGLLLEAVE